MFGKLAHELREPPRILVSKLQSRWTMPVCRSNVRHAVLKHGFCKFPGLLLKLRIEGRMRAIAATRNHKRQRTRRIGHAEVQRRETAHRIADHMRAIDVQRIQYRAD